MLTRRQILEAGLVAGMALVAGGCTSSRRWTPLSRDELEGPPRRLPARPGVPGPVPEAPVPGVIPRREWARVGPNLALINPMNGVHRITVHHDGMPPVFLRSRADVAARLEQIRRAHVSRNPPWADIGYHYIVDPQGRVWEGRPVQYQGAHVRYNNEHNLGIVVLGNFDEQRPTLEALAALDAFLADRMRFYRVPLSQVYTHQEIMPTACPGRNLQAYMLATRSRSGRLARTMA